MREPEADAYLLLEDDVLFFDREDLRVYLEDVLWRGLVGLGVLLRGEEDLLVVREGRVDRRDALLAAHEQRHDHVREHDDVAKRQQRQRVSNWHRTAR